jgi:hypothetical protein
VAPALSSERDDGEHRVLRVTTETVESNFLDLGDEGPSLGDQFLFQEIVRRQGEIVGDNGGVCSLTSVGEGEFNCVVTAHFEDGQLTAQFLFVPPTEFPHRETFPITGGSGVFEGASGEGHAVLLNENRGRVTLRLEF